MSPRRDQRPALWPRRNQAQADVQAAEAQIQSDALNLEFTHVVAPISGRISRKFVSVGNLVSGGDNSTLLTTIVSLDPIDFYFDADEISYLKYTRLSLAGLRPSSRDVANPVMIATSDETEFKHEGRMDFVDNSLDRNTGTMRGRALVPNPNYFFTPGQFGRVRLLGSAPYEALLIPDEAVSTDQSRKIVFVVGPDNVVQAHEVKLGRVFDGLRAITDGLEGRRYGRHLRPAAPSRRGAGNAANEGHRQRRSDRRGQAVNIGSLSIQRPVLALVLSIFILIVGALAYTGLPVSEYPEVAPPTVVVHASYPGASAQVASDTVATPIEQEINGVEDMLYMYSQSTGDGQVSITVTFKLGTDLDQAQVLVQNRVAIAIPRLPEEVQRIGVTTRKNSPDLLLVVFLTSPDDTYDQLYISNYALRRVRDTLLRLDGVGDIQIFGARDYSMRLWLDPDKIALLGLTAGEMSCRRRARAERAGCRRQDRRTADRRPRLPAQPGLHRPPDRPRRLRKHRRQGRRRRADRAPERCRPDRTGRPVLHDQQFPGAQARSRAGGVAAAGFERAGDAESHPEIDGGDERRISPRGWNTTPPITRPSSSRNRSRS